MKGKIVKSFAFIGLGAMLLAGCDGGNNDPKCIHEYDDWVIETVPSKTEKGLATRTCSLCEEVEEVVLPVLTDSSYTLGIDNATCTEGGRQNVFYNYSAEETIDFRVVTDPKGHDYVHHAADELSLTNPVGHDEYYTCSRCDLLFNGNKEVISSLEDIEISYYQSDAEYHWHGDVSTKQAHTFGEWETKSEVSYFGDGVKVRTCTVCGYKDKDITPRLDIGTLTQDGTYSSNSIATKDANGANKFVDGFYVFGSADSDVTFDTSGNIVFGGKAHADSRIFMIKVGGKASFVVKAGASGSGSATFGIFNGTPNETADNLVEGSQTVTTESFNEFTFTLPEAGTYLFGASAKMKFREFTFECHEIDNTTWQKDDDGHWHGNANPDCTCRNDYAAHTFGEWETTKPVVGQTDGEEQRKCSVCNYVQTRVVSWHKAATTYSSDEHTHWYACLDEGYEDLRIKEEEHTFDNGVAEGDDKIKYTCSVCGYHYYKHIATYLPGTEGGMVLSTGTNYTVSDESTKISFAGTNKLVTQDPARDFTTATGKKVTLANAIKTSGKDWKSGYIQLDLPGKCHVRLFLSVDTSANIRMWSDTTKSANYTHICDKPGDNEHVVAEFDANTADSYHIGSSSSSKPIYWYAVEIIYVQ